MKRPLLAAFCMAFLFAGSLPVLKYRALDNSGLPIASASLYSYEAGTTTPLATYSDEALSSANTNPVVADSSGYFGEIYMTPTSAYKFVLKDDSGTTIYTVDNIYASQLTSASIDTRLKQAASNPLDYRSAVGDGAADEYLAVQDAIDNRTLVVDLLGKTFRCDSAIELGSNTILRNGTLDFTNSTDNSFITFAGSQSADYTLSANGDPDDLQITLSTCSGIAAGDWLYVYSNANWTGSDLSGEIVQVESISSCVVQLSNPLEGEYLTANAAKAREYTPDSNIRLENLTINASSSQSGTGYVIHGEVAERVVLDNVTINNIKATGFRCEACWDVTITNSIFDNDNGSGQGVNAVAASRNWEFTNNQCHRLDTCVDIGEVDATYNDGVVRWIRVANNGMYGNEFGVAGLATSQYVSVVNNDIVMDDNTSGIGITYAGVDLEATGNRIRGGKYGVYHISSITPITGRSWTSVIRDNYIDYPDDNGIRVVLSGTWSQVAIEGNTIASWQTATDYGILANLGLGSATVTATNVSISGNHLYGSLANAHGIEVLQAVSGSTVTGMRINDNVVKVSGAGTGIYVARTAGTYSTVSVDGNIVVGSATTPKGIWVEDTTILSISDNTINTALIGIYYDNDGAASKSVTINGNSLETTKMGIHVEGASSCTVTGVAIANNTIEGVNAASNYGVYIDGYIADVAITGNVSVRDDDSDDAIHLAGDAAASITNATVSGNILVNGAYGIGEATDANSTNLYLSNNIFSSIATANFEGTVSAVDLNDVDVNNVGDINVDTVSADNTSVDYMDADSLELTQEDIGASCTVGQIRYDTGATDELCYCHTTDTWACWTTDTIAGPTD